MNIASETEPALIVWQVGIDDALAQAEIAPFAAALDEILAWFRSHEIDVVLVEPPYTKAMATDAHFTNLIATVRARARANEVPLIRRSRRCGSCSSKRLIRRRAASGSRTSATIAPLSMWLTR